MSDNNGETTGDVAAQTGAHQSAAPEGLEGMTELDLLKNRARMMDIRFSNNIGVDALKKKIEAKMAGEADATDENGNETHEEGYHGQDAAGVDGGVDGDVNSSPNPLSMVETPTRKLTLQEYVQQENMKLVRCRITNLDPKKKDLPGEIITVANEYPGTVRKFVPFGEHTEEGYHIPYCIYEMLRVRKFLNIRTTRDRRTGTQKVSQQWAPEFALEVLEPLTESEIAQLAQAQLAAGSIEANDI